MQDVRINEDGTPNLSDMHQLLDDMEAAGMIKYEEDKLWQDSGHIRKGLRHSDTTRRIQQQGWWRTCTYYQQQR